MNRLMNRLKNKLWNAHFFTIALCIVTTITGCTDDTIEVVQTQPAQFSLQLRSQPLSGAANQTLGAFEVVFVDPFGNLLPTPNSPVTVVLDGSSGAILGGTVVQTPVNGVATFDDLTISQSGGNYRLRFLAAGYRAVAADVVISSGVGTQLSFVSEPTNSAVGSQIGPVVVEVRDQDGVRVSNSAVSISLRLVDGQGAQLLGTTTKSANSGAASFDDLYLNQPVIGASLVAEAANINSSNSVAFDIGPSEIAGIRFSQTPASVVVNSSVRPPLSVELIDSSGALVTSAVAPVELSLGVGQTVRTQGLGASTPQNGVAQFASLRFRTVANNVQLQADCAIVNSAIFTPVFDVIEEAPSVTALSVPTNADLRGQVPVTFTVMHSAGERVDVRLEYSIAGAAFKAMTLIGGSSPATGSPSFVGTQRLLSSASGTTYTALWDSAFDLPNVISSDLEIRATATLRGLSGTSRNLNQQSLNNSASLTSSALFMTGSSPTRIATADFDCDGFVDLVVLEAGTSTVSVYRQDSNNPGQFGLISSFSAGSIPADVVVYDFDADQRLDIGIVKSGDNSIEIRFQDAANFSFLRNVNVATELFPSALEVADLNNDNRPDLIVVNSASNSVTVHLQANSGGLFQTFTSYAVGTLPERVVVADLNRDQRLDIAVMNRGSETVSILEQTAMVGQFQSAGTVATGRLPSDIAARDLNGDQATDLIVANHSDQTVQVFFQDSSNPGQFPTSSQLNIQDNPIRLLVNDLDNDAVPEVLALSQAGTTLTVLSVQGSQLVQEQQVSVGAAPSDLDIGRFCSNALNAELFVCSQGDSRVYRVSYQQLSPAVNRFLGTEATALTGQLSAVLGGEVSGDGFSDVVVLDSQRNELRVVHGDGQGKSLGESVFRVEAGPGLLKLVDINGDFSLDAVIANVSSNTVSVVNLQTLATAVEPGFGTVDVGGRIGGLGAGFFGNSAEPAIFVSKPDAGVVRVLQRSSTGYISSEFAAGASPSALAAFDIEHDSLSDLAVANVNSDTVTVLRQHATGFQSHVMATGQMPSFIWAGDLNNDGDSDLVVANTGDSTVTVFLGDQLMSSGFMTGVSSATGSGPIKIAVFDVTGDGQPEIVTLNQDDSVSVLVADTNNAGFFNREFDYAISAGVTSIDAIDVDSNGRADLAMVSSSGELLVVRLGLSMDGYKADFGAVAQVPADTDSAIGVDLDNNGRSEVVSVSLGNGNYSVSVQGNNGAFSPAQSASVSSPGGVTAAELNGDTEIDLFISNSAANTGIGLFQDSSTPFSFSSSQTTMLDQEPGVVIAADLTADGVAEIVSLNRTSGSVLITEQDLNNRGQFLPPTIFMTGGVPQHAVIADLDSDSDMDVVVAIGGPEVVVLANSQGLGVTQFQQSRILVNVNAVKVWVVDYDADGRNEVVVLSDVGTLHLVQRDLATTNSSYTTSLLPNTVVNDAEFLDVDSDGRMDLAVATDTGVVVYSNGTQSTVEVQRLATGSRVERLFVKDMNGDSKPDLVALESQVGRVTVFSRD